MILASIMSVSLVEIAYMLGCSGSNSFMTGWVMSDYGHPTEIITRSTIALGTVAYSLLRSYLAVSDIYLSVEARRGLTSGRKKLQSS
jgi:hypothetical protein